MTNLIAEPTPKEMYSVTGRGFIRIVLITLAASSAVGLCLSIKNSQAIGVFLSSLQLVLILQLSLLLEV